MSIFKKIAEKLSKLGLPILAQAAGKGNPLVGAIIQTLTGKGTVEEAADAIPDQLTGDQVLAWQQAELANRQALLDAEVETFREGSMTARAFVQSDDRFVRWQIPGIFFMFNLSLFWNFFLAPISTYLAKVVGAFAGIPELSTFTVIQVPIPPEVCYLVMTMVTGLLAKKTFDNNEIKMGSFHSPARS